MKIVNLETFRKLPLSTLFMKYEPCYFEDLCAKGDTWEDDFLYASITNEIEYFGDDSRTTKLWRSQNDPNFSLKMDFDYARRDACFKDKQLFAVYEKADVEGLIEKLTRCLLSYS